MIQESEEERGRTEASVAAIALGPGAASSGAKEFFEAQSRLTRLQIGDVKREDKLRHWSLRMRHINDVLKKQLAIVRHLDLTSFQKSELARMRASHG